MKHYAKKPLPENKWNPLLKYPRNEACFCGSNIKFKNCCLKITSPVISKEHEDEAKQLVKIVKDLLK